MIAILALTLFAALYVAGQRRMGHRRRRWRSAAFAVGWSAAVAALGQPLHELAETELWAHMLQHEMLIVIAAPLLALSRFDAALLALLQPSRRAPAARWLKRLRINMPVACALHAIALWIWHLPLLYEMAVRHPLLHGAEHGSFFGTALLFWWAALARRSGYGAAALYTFATSLHTGILGALLFLAPRPWYPAYGSGAQAMADQQLAGLIMWVPGGAVLALSALLLFWRWLDDMEKRSASSEMAVYITTRS